MRWCGWAGCVGATSVCNGRRATTGQDAAETLNVQYKHHSTETTEIQHTSNTALEQPPNSTWQSALRTARISINPTLTPYVTTFRFANAVPSWIAASNFGDLQRPAPII